MMLERILNAAWSMFIVLAATGIIAGVLLCGLALSGGIGA